MNLVRSWVDSGYYSDPTGGALFPCMLHSSQSDWAVSSVGRLFGSMQLLCIHLSDISCSFPWACLGNSDSWRWRTRTPLTYSSSRQEEQLPEGPSPHPTIVLTFAIEWWTCSHAHHSQKSQQKPESLKESPFPMGLEWRQTIMQGWEY